MAREEFSVRALKRNIRHLLKLNPEYIPVLKQPQSLEPRIVKEILRSHKTRPVLVSGSAEVDCIQSFGNGNTVIQEYWQGEELQDNVIPVLNAGQIPVFDTSKPFAVFSDYDSAFRGVSSAQIPEGANLAFVFYRGKSRSAPVTLTEALQDDIDSYKAKQPEVVISVGSSADLLENSGLCPRVGLALFGYDSRQRENPNLSPVRTLTARILGEIPPSPDEIGFHYLIDAGHSSGNLSHLRCRAQSSSAAFVYVTQNIRLHESIIHSNMPLQEGETVQLLGPKLDFCPSSVKDRLAG